MAIDSIPQERMKMIIDAIKEQCENKTPTIVEVNWINLDGKIYPNVKVEFDDNKTIR